MILHIDNCTLIDTRDVYRVIPVSRQILGGEPDAGADIWLAHHSGCTEDFVKMRVDMATAERILKEKTKEAV